MYPSLVWSGKLSMEQSRVTLAKDIIVTGKVVGRSAKEMPVLRGIQVSFNLLYLDISFSTHSIEILHLYLLPSRLMTFELPLPGSTGFVKMDRE